MPATAESAAAAAPEGPAPGAEPLPPTDTPAEDAAPTEAAPADGQVAVRVLRPFRIQGESVPAGTEMRLPIHLALALEPTFKVEILR